MRIRAHIFFAAIGLASTSGVCLAQAGSLDPTFGNGGIVTTDVLGVNYEEGGCSTTIQSDGKVLVVASSISDYSYDTVVIRYNQNGSLDTGFGGGGVVRIGLYAGRPKVALDDIGRILVSAIPLDSGANSYDMAVFRFLADGTPDPSFGVDGIAIAGLPGRQHSSDMDLDSQGRILLLGGNGATSPSTLLVARFLSNGSLDSSFDGDGLAVATKRGSWTRLAVDSLDRVVIAQSGPHDFHITRLTSGGVLDPSFGGGTGGALVNFAGMTGWAMEVDGANRIVVGGHGDGGFSVARVIDAGILDSNFGTNGGVVVPYPAGYRCRDLAIQDDDRVVAVGRGVPPEGGVPAYFAARFTVGGLPDASFGINGRAYASFSTEGYVELQDAQSVAIDAQGRMVLAGVILNSWNSIPHESADVGVVRFTATGDLDSSFGDAGRVMTAVPGPASNWATDVVAKQADGKTVVVGSVSDWWYHAGGDTRDSWVIARYESDGALDTAFGDGGLVTIDLPGEEGGWFDWVFDGPQGVAVDGKGRIVVAGRMENPTGRTDMTVYRLRSDGSLDPQFGDSGVTRVISLGYEVVTSLEVDAANNVFVAGSIWDPATGQDFLVARFDNRGALDPGFGTGGIAFVDFGGSDYCADMRLDDAGHLVLAGYTYVMGGSDFAVARLNAVDGSLDTSFGNLGSPGAGLVAVDVAGSDDWLSGMDVQLDGRIVLVGPGPSGARDFAVARLTTDGVLDDSFGSPDGFVLTDIAGGQDWANDVRVQADGRVVVVGGTQSGAPTGSDFAVVRYDADGSLDTLFGNGGIVVTDLGSYSDTALAVDVRAHGQIVAVGYTYQPGTGPDFAIVRYLSIETPQVIIEVMTTDVEMLVAEGTLTNGQGNALLSKLEASMQQADREQINSAINQMEAFKNQLDAFVGNGTLTAAEAQDLYYFADAAILLMLAM